MYDITPTSVAAQEAPLRTLELLFEHGASTAKGQLLHYAALREGPDAPEVIEYLIEKGAPTNEVSYSKHPVSYKINRHFAVCTPIQKAIQRGRIDIVKTLLAYGADPTIPDSRGKTALQGVGRSSSLEELECLRLCFPGEASLWSSHSLKGRVSSNFQALI